MVILKEPSFNDKVVKSLPLILMLAPARGILFSPDTTPEIFCCANEEEQLPVSEKTF